MNKEGNLIHPRANPLHVLVGGKSIYNGRRLCAGLQKRANLKIWACCRKRKGLAFEIFVSTPHETLGLFKLTANWPGFLP